MASDATLNVCAICNEEFQDGEIVTSFRQLAPPPPAWSSKVTSTVSSKPHVG